MKQTKDVNPSELPEFEKTDIILPSGKVVTIRESTGEDDDILSKRDDKLEHLNKFLARIVVDPDMSTNDVKKLLVRDKYFLLLKSRIFSLGSELLFTHTFSDGTEADIEEDLTIFDHDYSEEWNPDSKAPRPYITDDPTVEFNLSSGKICRYEYLTGLHEKSLLDNKEITLTNLNINMMMTVRKFALKINDSWALVQRFNMLKSREMAEIRKHIERNDPEWGALMSIPHPNGGPTEYVSIFQVPDFFFPAG
jgi:hypothetical protein